ncbi:hypothetical protein PoB_003289500 [Plakobranchus ocellatus]|uniref:Uncharacterized protein n=1 Tax=Plakobranchus ocellatus TaxID=259542 RepID=A0AAV4AHY9_9GAST|nr:hypothetical protein PoB_003289500 [Plakobranchus ocellatus]
MFVCLLRAKRVRGMESPTIGEYQRKKQSITITITIVINTFTTTLANITTATTITPSTPLLPTSPPPPSLLPPTLPPPSPPPPIHRHYHRHHNHRHRHYITTTITNTITTTTNIATTITTTITTNTTTTITTTISLPQQELVRCKLSKNKSKVWEFVFRYSARIRVEVFGLSKASTRSELCLHPTHFDAQWDSASTTEPSLERHCMELKVCYGFTRCLERKLLYPSRVGCIVTTITTTITTSSSSSCTTTTTIIIIIIINSLPPSQSASILPAQYQLTHARKLERKLLYPSRVGCIITTITTTTTTTSSSSSCTITTTIIIIIINSLPPSQSASIPPAQYQFTHTRKAEAPSSVAQIWRLD